MSHGALKSVEGLEKASQHRWRGTQLRLFDRGGTEKQCFWNRGGWSSAIEEGRSGYVSAIAEGKNGDVSANDETRCF